MSTDYSACGAYGILLTEEELGHIFKDLEGQANNAMPEDADEDEYRQSVGDKFLEPIIARFAELGIAIPDGASIFTTGCESDRPGRCITPAAGWVIGFGLYWMPLNPAPYMSDEFKEASTWHTWVTAG